MGGYRVLAEGSALLAGQEGYQQDSRGHQQRDLHGRGPNLRDTRGTGDGVTQPSTGGREGSAGPAAVPVLKLIPPRPSAPLRAQHTAARECSARECSAPAVDAAAPSLPSRRTAPGSRGPGSAEPLQGEPNRRLFTRPGRGACGGVALPSSRGVRAPGSPSPTSSPPGRGSSRLPRDAALSPTQRSASSSAPRRSPAPTWGCDGGRAGGGTRRCPVSLPLTLPQSRLLANLGSDLVLIRAGARDFYSLDPLLESRRTCLIS